VATSTDRAYQQFWGRLIGQVRSSYPDWGPPTSPPPQNWLSFRREQRWFSYDISFGRGELCSELYIRVPDDAAAAERVMDYLKARSAGLEAAYGKRLRYQYPSDMPKSQVAGRLSILRSGSIREIGEHDAYLDWFLHSQARLRSAVDSIGGLSALREQAEGG